MGQSSEKTQSSASDRAGETRKDDSMVVLSCDDLLGRCWLLGSSNDSFSPSRWFPLSERTRKGSRGEGKRAFRVSAKKLSSVKRDKISFLTRYPITVTEGLDVTGFDNVSVAAYTFAELSGKHALLLGGQQVEIPGDLPSSFPFFLVLSIKRVELEMQVSQHESRRYVRIPLRAPASDEAGRQEVGEGCITGVTFGGYLVVGCAQPCAEYVCERLGRALKGVAVKVENKGKTPEPTLDLSSTCTADSFRVLSCSLHDSEVKPYTSVSFQQCPLEKVLEALVTCAQRVYTDPHRWVITSLFMQRYEALGAYILRAS